jgi:hypothetical protein
MATTVETFGQGTPGAAVKQPAANLSTRPTSTFLFDGLMVLLGFWFMTGLFLDGSAHDRGLVDSFFTPWHAILYSGFLANAIALFVATWRNQAKGYRLWAAIPAGYEMSLVGAVVFGIGGVLDMLWHVTFGIERSTEALLSPSHMILAVGLFLIVNGPFRAAWRRRDDLLSKNRLGWLPMLFSLAFTFLLLTFFTFPMNPFFNVFASLRRYEYSVNDSVLFGFPQMLLQAAIFMGCVLMAARRWKLPPGSVTFVLLLNVLALSVISDRAATFIPAAIVTGVFADGFMLLLKPSIKRPVLFRIYAFSVPAVLYALYFATLQLNGGVSWTLPFWSGTVVITGLVGLFLSYLMLPAPGLAVTPAEQTA